MEIVHHVMFGRNAELEGLVEILSIKHKRTPGITDSDYLISFEIPESDSRWLQISGPVQQAGVPNMCETIFSNEEILNADWLRMVPTFEHGYPQPEGTWVGNPVNYDNVCHACGVFRQKASFHLKKEPNLRKNDFMMLFWTDAFFCTPRVFQEFEAQKLRGYEKWEAIIYKTKEPSKTVAQLFIPHVAAPGLVEVDDLKRATCKACGITKYYPHVRGKMYLREEALIPEVDFMRTYEWFGDGHAAFRETLVSNRVAKLIIDKGWRGVRFKLVELAP